MNYLPTLLAIALALTLQSAAAQVGVNEPNPTQTLDVNGKIKVGDDATAPERGTIRFNDATDEFEGYDGTGWKVLSLQTTTPSSPTRIAYTGRSNSTIKGAAPASALLYQTGELNPSAPSTFTNVPAGKHFLVTMIFVEDNGIASRDDLYDVTISSTTGATRFENSIRLIGSTQSTDYIIGGIDNPLIVMRPGEKLRILEELGNTRVNANFRGFLVDELDF